MKKLCEEPKMNLIDLGSQDCILTGSPIEIIPGEKPDVDIGDLEP